MKGLVLAMVVLLIWSVGLMSFADRVARMTPAADPAPADGIIALTGGSDLRLAAATHLLEMGMGRRLLVSGVNRQASRRDLMGVTGATKRMFDCCIDLGFVAANTVGNARETAQWARTLRYRQLILVTADYHMPRALMELRAADPEAIVTPFPISTPSLDARRWQATSEGSRRMVLEYCKYLAILARVSIMGLGPDAHPARGGD